MMSQWHSWLVPDDHSQVMLSSCNKMSTGQEPYILLLVYIYAQWLAAIRQTTHSESRMCGLADCCKPLWPSRFLIASMQHIWTCWSVNQYHHVIEAQYRSPWSRLDSLSKRSSGCPDHRSITTKFVTLTAPSCIDNSWRSTTLPTADLASSNQTLPFQNEHEWVLEKLR